MATIINKEVFEKQKIKWKGKNPDKIYPYLTNFLKDMNYDVKEEKYKHKRPPGKDEEQEIEWEAKRNLDQYTKSIVKLKFTGKMARTRVQEDDKVNEMYVGEMEIEVTGILRTEYNQETTFEKSIFYSLIVAFYERFFYNSIKKKFENVCREDAKKIFNEIKSFFAVQPYM